MFILIFGTSAKSFSTSLGKLRGDFFCKWADEILENFPGIFQNYVFFGLRAKKTILQQKNFSRNVPSAVCLSGQKGVKMKLNFREKQSKNNFRFSAKQFQTLSKKYVSFVKGASIVSRETFQKTCFPGRILCLNFRKLSERNWVSAGNISAELS